MSSQYKGKCHQYAEGEQGAGKEGEDHNGRRYRVPVSTAEEQYLAVQLGFLRLLAETFKTFEC